MSLPNIWDPIFGTSCTWESSPYAEGHHDDFQVHDRRVVRYMTLCTYRSQNDSYGNGFLILLNRIATYRSSKMTCRSLKTNFNQTLSTFLYNISLSQPNNNHNPNNKTTITVVGLRESNRWKPPPPPPTTTRNSKLHDRAEIEQNSENKSYQSILGDPKTVFEPYPNPKNSPLGPQKVKNDPKIKSKSNVRI